MERYDSLHPLTIIVIDSQITIARCRCELGTHLAVFARSLSSANYKPPRLSCQIFDNHIVDPTAPPHTTLHWSKPRLLAQASLMEERKERSKKPTTPKRFSLLHTLTL
ncbi:hypothetical protein RJT34_10810 [Clitoria ternatea]|uniref:Uncharacterized protein n=1 Tax=Clitoria ternatea TaxID=43366 RepID=A0AAN9JMC5_CLITE